MKDIDRAILAMNIIQEECSLSCEYETDARSTWPKRWNRLRNELMSIQNEPIAKLLTKFKSN